MKYKLTDDQIAEARVMRTAGASYRKIGAALDISYEAIRLYLNPQARKWDRLRCAEWNKAHKKENAIYRENHREERIAYRRVHKEEKAARYQNHRKEGRARQKIYDAAHIPERIEGGCPYRCDNESIK